MARRIIFFLLLLQSGFSLNANAVAEDDGQRLAMLAARGEILPCRELYDSLQSLAPTVRDSVMPPEVALFCRLAFARAHGDARQTIAIVDSLEQMYESKSDVRGLLALADVRLEVMRNEGLWDDLANYCRERLQWCARRNIKASRRKTFMQHQSLARHFAKRPPVSVQWQSDSSAIPVSRDWPLLLPVSANNKHELPFIFHTAQNVSVVSEADLKDWGIPLPETEPISITVQGKSVKARPVIVDNLHIGGLTVTDIMLYVVDASVNPPYNRALGTDVLRRIPYICFSDQQAFVRRTAPTFDTIANQAKTALGNSSAEDGSVQTFRLFLSPSGSFQAANHDSTEIIDTSVTSYNSETDSLSVHTWDLTHLKATRTFAMDLQNQQLILASPREYHPLKIADYIASDDLFGLLRNEASLLLTATADEIATMEAILDKTLTPPAAEELDEALQHAVLSPNEAAVSTTKPGKLLLRSQRGLLYEETVGQEIFTRVLDAQHLGNHRIDLKNMLLY